MRVLSWFLLLGGASALVSSSGRGNLLHRTLSSQQASAAMQDKRALYAEAAASRARRRAQASDWSSFVEKAYSGQKLDPDSIKLLGDADHGQLNDALLGGIIEQVSGQDVADMFDHFKILQTVPAYQAFVESGSDDPAEKENAQLAAFRDLSMSALATAKAVLEEGGPMKLGQSLIDEADAGMQADITAMSTNGDANAFARIEQAFANKYLGGVDLSAMYDNEWVDKMRAGFFSDPNLSRVLGDDKILSILRNPDMRMLSPADFETPEGVDKALAAFIPEV